jgi:hypothetical protein
MGWSPPIGRGFPVGYYHSYCAPSPHLSRFGGTGHVPAKVQNPIRIILEYWNVPFFDCYLKFEVCHSDIMYSVMK